jgi:hypothetical protein
MWKTLWVWLITPSEINVLNLGLIGQQVNLYDAATVTFRVKSAHFFFESLVKMKFSENIRAITQNKCFTLCADFHGKIFSANCFKSLHCKTSFRIFRVSD